MEAATVGERPMTLRARKSDQDECTTVHQFHCTLRRIFVGQAGSLRPIGNRPAELARPTACRTCVFSGASNLRALPANAPLTVAALIGQENRLQPFQVICSSKA